MGNLGTYFKGSYIDYEMDINFKSYRAISDEWLKDNFEDKYIFLHLIPFRDFYFLLLKEKSQTKEFQLELKKFSISSSDTVLNKYVTKEQFNSFINDILFEHPILKKQIKNEQHKTKCEHFLLYIYSCLKKRIFKYQYGSEYIPEKTKIITKLHLLAIGFVFCSGRNIEKIDFLFRIFSEQDEIVRRNENIFKFLLCIFLISSQCVLYANLKMDIDDYEKFPFKFLNTVRHSFSLRNIEIGVNSFNNSFFEENDFYEYNDFINIFKYRDFDWIFSSSGIRYYLELNDEKESSNWGDLMKNYAQRTILKALKNIKQKSEN